MDFCRTLNLHSSATTGIFFIKVSFEIFKRLFHEHSAKLVPYIENSIVQKLKKSSLYSGLPRYSDNFSSKKNWLDFHYQSTILTGQQNIFEKLLEKNILRLGLCPGTIIKQ